MAAAPVESNEQGPGPGVQRHMSDVEALMWNVDKDPFLSSTFGSVTLLDCPPDFAELRRRLLRAVKMVPRLGQRVVPVFGRVAPPEWHDDPDFDIDYHLRHVALPAPGNLRQLFDLATLTVSDGFDRTRPLWQFIVVEGLVGDRAALVQKMHHTITDGEGGIRMSEQFIDIERSAEARPDPDLPTASGEPPVERNLAGATLEAISHQLRRTAGGAKRAAADTLRAVTHPADLPSGARAAVETAGSVARQVAVTDSSHSPLWRQRTLRRRLETADVSFDEARRAAKTLGGSLNDLFVAAAAGAAGAYHRANGVEIEDLRMAMPVSMRSGRDRSAGGNAFVPARVLVPAGIADPQERFNRIHEILSATKQERALGLVNSVAGLANLLPTSVVVKTMRQQVETVDFTASNVRAAPFDLYVSGARIEGTYPLGPLTGTAWNVTMMSYCGMLNLGIHIDTGAVGDPELLRDCLSESFAELIAAAG